MELNGLMLPGFARDWRNVVDFVFFLRGCKSATSWLYLSKIHEDHNKQALPSDQFIILFVVILSVGLIWMGLYSLILENYYGKWIYFVLD